jgi:hypothetical protein
MPTSSIGKFVVAEWFRYKTTGPDERVLVLVGPNMGVTQDPKALVEAIVPTLYDTEVEAMDALRAHDWPGLVLQVINVTP